MTLTVTQWNQLRDETRNAAVAIHFARIAFTATPSEDNRKTLREARDAYTDKVLQIQDAIVDDLDISYLPNEHEAHEELLAAPMKPEDPTAPPAAPSQGTEGEKIEPTPAA